jgi:hypothetical protein
VTTAEMGPRGSRPGDLHRRRVLLLAESAGLAAVLHHLLDPSDRLSRIGSLRELAETRALESTDVVVLDVPAEDRAAAVSQLRRRYLGPLVVLVTRGDNTRGLHLDNAANLLVRPFSADELGAALATQGHPGRPGALRPASLWTAEPSTFPDDLRSPTGGPDPEPGRSGAGPASTLRTAAAGPGTAVTGTGQGTAGPRAVDVKAAARKAPVRRAPATRPGPPGLVERGQRLLVALTQGWKARRRVRVASFSAFALVAFTVAFALASQGRCGPGCDALETGFSPAPTAPSESRAASTTGPKRSTTTGPTGGSPATGAFRGIAGGRTYSGGSTTTLRKATTTTDEPAGSPTTRPATTRPATTQSTVPPTTAPPTTAPPTTAPPTTAGA